MPRIHLKKEIYMKEDTADLIRRKMRGNFSQKEMGAEFGIGQSAFSQKLEKMDFSYPQLVRIFWKLGFSEEEIIKCMKK